MAGGEEEEVGRERRRRRRRVSSEGMETSGGRTRGRGGGIHRGDIKDEEGEKKENANV